MADNGVIVASTGFALASYSSALQMQVATGFVDALAEAGFACVRDYDEVRSDGRFLLCSAIASDTNISSILRSGASWF